MHLRSALHVNRQQELTCKWKACAHGQRETEAISASGCMTQEAPQLIVGSTDLIISVRKRMNSAAPHNHSQHQCTTQQLWLRLHAGLGIRAVREGPNVVGK